LKWSIVLMKVGEKKTSKLALHPYSIWIPRSRTKARRVGSGFHAVRSRIPGTSTVQDFATSR
jgi:hypothetical protein